MTNQECLCEDQARLLFGNRFFDATDYLKYYGYVVTNRQLTEIGPIPWSEEILESVDPFDPHHAIYETHQLFLGLDRMGLGTQTIYKWFRHSLTHPDHPQFYNPLNETHPLVEPMYSQNRIFLVEQFARLVTCELKWYLARIEIPQNTTYLSWPQMNKYMAKQATRYTIPSPIIELTRIITYLQKNEPLTILDPYSACNTIDSTDQRVLVALVNRKIHINGWSSALPSSNIGIRPYRRQWI